jgi:Ca2+/Na+ antiporter
MGIGILAIGSSIPEVVSGIINARRGENPYITTLMLFGIRLTLTRMGVISEERGRNII